MGSMTSSIRRTIKRSVDFVLKPAARYPADPRAIFILVLSVFTGLTAFLVQAAPSSLEALLPRWGVLLWDGILVVGSAVTLLGMAKQTVNGVITEQVGSVMVAAATLFYSGLAFYSVGVNALQVVGIVLAWGLACLIRWAQLQALIQQTYHKQIENQIRAEVESEQQ